MCFLISLNNDGNVILFVTHLIDIIYSYLTANKPLFTGLEVYYCLLLIIGQSISIFYLCSRYSQNPCNQVLTNCYTPTGGKPWSTLHWWQLCGILTSNGEI